MRSYNSKYILIAVSYKMYTLNHKTWQFIFDYNFG